VVTGKTPTTVTLKNPSPAFSNIPLADNTQNGLMRMVSGNVTDYVGGDNRCHALPAISSGGTSHYYDYDDFMGLSPKFVGWNNGGGGSAVSAIALAAATIPFGFVQLAPGSVANGYSRLYANAVFMGNNPIIWRTLVNPVNAGATSQTQHVIGFASSNSASIATTGYYIVIFYQGNGGANWQIQVRSLTAATTVDSGIAATLNTWFDLKIIATSTSVQFYINGALITTITTNIPPASQLLFPSVFMASGVDTTNRSIYIDAIELDIDTGVPGRFMKTPV